jgi:hypothetical protein
MDIPPKSPSGHRQLLPHHAQRGGWIAVGVYVAGVAVWYLVWQFIH